MEFSARLCLSLNTAYRRIPLSQLTSVGLLWTPCLKQLWPPLALSLVLQRLLQAVFSSAPWEP